MQSNNLCLSIGIFSLFIFNVIVDIFWFKSIFYLLPTYPAWPMVVFFCFVLFFSILAFFLKYWLLIFYYYISSYTPLLLFFYTGYHTHPWVIKSNTNQYLCHFLYNARIRRPSTSSWHMCCFCHYFTSLYMLNPQKIIIVVVVLYSHFIDIRLSWA